MKKKIFTCLVISLLFSTMLMGQSEKNSSQSFPRHEVSLGYGDVLLGISPIYDYWSTSYTPNYDWFDSNTYRGDEISPGAFSLSYMFGLKKWLWLGVSTTYTSFYQNIYDFSHQKVATDSGHKLAIIPMVRFMYVNKEKFNLYSACGLGASFALYNNAENGFCDLTWHPVIQLTGIGVSVGKELRGFAELGCGPRGIINFGIQYRFGE